MMGFNRRNGLLEMQNSKTFASMVAAVHTCLTKFTAIYMQKPCPLFSSDRFAADSEKEGDAYKNILEKFDFKEVDAKCQEEKWGGLGERCLGGAVVRSGPRGTA